MQVKILEPKGILWQGLAKQVILPTEEGEMGVLDFHQPFIIRLKKGDVRCSMSGLQLSEEKTKSRTGNYFSIKAGIAFMKSNELSLFVET